jgi:hypothetical protein
MQTFLPYPSFTDSLKCLDFKRLNSQCNEALLIVKTIEENRKPWSNHPAVNQWRKYLTALKIYYNTAVLIWNSKRKKNGETVKQRILLSINNNDIRYPIWLGKVDYHNSHKSNLLRKYPKHYTQFNWNVPDNLPYIWPSKEI